MGEQPQFRPMGIATAIAWAAAAFVGIPAASQLVLWSSRTGTVDVVSLGAVLMLVLGGLSLAILGAHGGPSYTKEATTGGEAAWWLRALGFGRAVWLVPVTGLLVGVASKIPADALRAWVEEIAPSPSLELAAKAMLLQHGTLGELLALFLVVGFLGPLFEEIFYRGVLFGKLAESGHYRAALVVTTVAFTVSHPFVRDWPSLLLLSCIFAALRHLTGTVWAPLCAHVSFNSSTILLAVLGGAQLDSATTSISPWLLLVTLAATVLLLLFIARFSDVTE